MLELATEIIRKCSLISICCCIISNNLDLLCDNDSTLSKKLSNLSPESVSTLMPILAEKIL